MDIQLIVLCVLTFIIYLIGALAYAARIAGVRTRKIAVSFALFNVLVLVSRAANSFQAPFLSKRIELNLLNNGRGAVLGFPDPDVLRDAGRHRRHADGADRAAPVHPRDPALPRQPLDPQADHACLRAGAGSTTSRRR